jgi:phenylacetate-CoA ligase
VIADEVRAGRAALDRIARIETLGETLDDHVRERVAAAWPDAALRDLYSSQEVGLLAAECPDGGALHVMAEQAIVEVLDDAGAAVAPGEVGHVVVTDLHNLATPIIRYEQGDLAEVGGPCACGRGLPTLARVRGRERNLLRLADGRAFFPIFGVTRYRSVAPVLQQQVVQPDVDTLEVRLVVERDLTTGEEDGLRRIIVDSIGHPLAVRFTYHERLERGPTGKYEEFVSQVPRTGPH